MKVIMNRNLCIRHAPACEACFAGKLMLNAFDVADCVLEIRDPERTEIVTIQMTDRDGTEKTLIIDRDNWPDAYDSWMLLYQSQQAGLAG
jgi:hypothetical protein